MEETVRMPAATESPIGVHSELPITEARDQLAEVANRVLYRHDRVVLTRHGRAVAAIVSLADLELLEQIEDWIDLREARAALAERENQATATDWEEIKAQL
jgi:prevent-host-death family protein